MVAALAQSLPIPGTSTDETVQPSQIRTIEAIAVDKTEVTILHRAKGESAEAENAAESGQYETSQRQRHGDADDSRRSGLSNVLSGPAQGAGTICPVEPALRSRAPTSG